MKTGRMLIAIGIIAMPFFAGARDVVDVAKPGAGKVRIDTSAMQLTGGAASATFKKTLDLDLDRSGWFEIADPGKGSIVVAGKCQDSGGRVSFAADIEGLGRKYLSKTYADDSSAARRLAHAVADEIVMAVKGVRGVASTRIVFIGKVKGKKELFLCDRDGGNAMQLTHDGAICTAPNWSPDGSKVIYTSDLAGYQDAYQIDISSFKRRVLAQYPGLNLTGDFSPDGRRIALSLSKDGEPAIYVVSSSGKGPIRLTKRDKAAKASPSWSPDGKELVFVSNKSGKPHLYVMDAGGGEQRRITFRGTENVAPDWGPKGIIYSSLRGGKYQICVYDPATGNDSQLTGGEMDGLDPSWAPDGYHAVFARSAGFKSELYVLDTLGNPPVRLPLIQGDWSAPAWSP